jgi:hypothetical protein
MKEKASFKESGEDQIPRVDPDAPGLAPGEELAIDPVGGDEIDPIRKWWDEAEATSREKAKNRRLEELEAGAEGILDVEGRALPRRRKRPEPPKIEVEDIPGLPGPKEAFAPVIADEFPVILPPVAESAAVEGPEERGLSLDGGPDASLKRHARGVGKLDEFDLSEFFGSKRGESKTHTEGEGVAEPGDKDYDDHTEGNGDEGIPVVSLGGAAEDSAASQGKEDPGLDLGDFFEPVAAKDALALHFEFSDLGNESPAPVATDIAIPEGANEAFDEAKIEAAPSLYDEASAAGEKDPVPVAAKTESDERASIFKAPEKINAPVPVEAVKVDQVHDDGDEFEEIPFAVGEKPEEKAEEPAAEVAEKDADEAPVPVGAEKSIESSNAEPLGEGCASAPNDGAEQKPGTDPDPSPVVETDAAGPPVFPAAATPEPRKKAGCWTVFATLFFFATLLLVVVLGVAGWFAWSRLGDFETELTSRVRSNLEKKGIYLDYGEWSYQFPRGLVFEEVTIFDDATRERPLIKAAGVGLKVDLLGLAKTPGEPGVGEINLQDSSLSLFEAGNLVTRIEGIDGEILTGSEDIRVDRLSALLGGWRVTLNGVVTLPQASPLSAEASAPTTDGGTDAAPLTLDLSAFKALEPWLALGDSGGNAPALDLTFAMDADQPDLATIEGSILGRDVIWQGVDIVSVTATFNVVPETGELSVPSFQIGYGQGFIGGRLAVDTVTQRLRIEQLQSTVDVLALLGQYKPAWVERWKSIRLIDAPSFQITGEVPFEDPAQADLKIRYDHRQGLVVAVEKGELPLRDLRGNFAVNRGSLETNDAGFGLFGGLVQINGATRLTDEARPFNGLIEITGLSLKEAAAFFGNDESGMSGRLSFVFRGAGYSDITRIRGGGTLRVEEAVIPDFPVLGEIQAYVGRAVPAFGLKGQGNVTGAYIIESGVLVASDLTVANTAARIVTNGSVNLSSYQTDFTALAELVPSLALATGLTGKAITFAGKGPLSDPAVTLKTFPLEFASVSLGSILGTSPRSLETLRIVPGVEEAVGAFADRLGGPGVTIHPEVTTFFKSLLGGEAPAPEAPAESQAE